MIKKYLEKNNIDTCNVEDVIRFLELDGIIHTTYFYHLEIYKFMIELEKTCDTRKEVIATTSQHFRITQRRCYTILNNFNRLKK